MKVVYCFFPGDEALALKNLEWALEVGPQKNHSALLLFDNRCSQERVAKAVALAKEIFHEASARTAAAQIDGWPQGANYFFRLATGTLANERGCPYFFWWEPDAIPTQSGWLDAIQKEYEAARRPFMGDRVEVRLEGKEVPLHMSGVAVYPNPLHAFAGEAYRAHDVAFDMAGKDQIVPQAHWTRLIVHNWKHEPIDTFDKLANIRSQHPEMVIFHSDKSGKLIDLLREEKQRGGSLHPTQAVIPEQKKPETPVHIPGSPSPLSPDDLGTVIATNPPIYVPPLNAAPVLADPLKASDVEPGNTTHTRSGEARESNNTVNNGGNQSARKDSRGGVQPTCDIFIRTYPADYQWLQYCLRSINKFAKGFRKIWIVSPDQKPQGLMEQLGYDWLVKNEESEDGYLSQQIHKLYADVLTDYQADYILHIDSDTLLTRETRLEDFFQDGKLVWPCTPYGDIKTPWQPITEKFLRLDVQYEFMRRFPIVVPRWLYARLREYCYHVHKRIISEYVRNQPFRSFSEFNALGAYAYHFHKERFHFLDTSKEAQEAPRARQFWSPGGLTPEVMSEIKTILSGKGEEPDETLSERIVPEENSGRVKAWVSPDTTHINTFTEPDSEAIKVLPNNLWVIKEDTHVSKWVEEQKRLDHDMNSLPFILPLIKPGDIVVDGGAFIGDHTIAYARAVGPLGMVFAFEPNFIAFKCLMHNMENYSNVTMTEAALGEKTGMVNMQWDNNYGACHVGSAGINARLVPLDMYDIEPDLIKLDVEGYELKALRGAEQTINKYRPRLVIEVNQEALARQGDSARDVLTWLREHNYQCNIMQENCTIDSPMYDVVALPAHQVVEILEKHTVPLNLDNGEPPHLTPYGEVVEMIGRIKAFADKSPNNRMRVMMRLSHAGLKPRWKKKKRVKK